MRKVATSATFVKSMKTYRIILFSLCVIAFIACVATVINLFNNEGVHILHRPVTFSDAQWRVEGTFSRRGNYGGEANGIVEGVKNAEWFSYWGSHAGADSNTGVLTSPPFTLDDDVWIYLTGRPLMSGVSIRLIGLDSQTSIPFKPSFDPGDHWRAFKLPAPTNSLGERVRLEVADNSKNFGGWVGTSVPFHRHVSTPLLIAKKVLNQNAFLPLLATISLLLTALYFPSRTAAFARRHPKTTLSAAISAAMIILSVFLAPLSRYLLTVNFSLQLLFVFAALIFPGFFLLRLLLPPTSKESSLILSPAVTITLMGSLFTIWSLTTLSPVWLFIALAATYCVIAILAVIKRRVRDVTRIGPLATRGLIMAFIASLIAVNFIVAGMENPMNDLHTYGQICKRGFHDMPPDNYLQYSVAKTLANRAEPWLWPDAYEWTMGDRPPLMGATQAVFAISMFRPSSFEFWFYELIGIVLNALFLIPLPLIIAKTFKNPLLTGLIPVFVALNPFMFLNIYYTWPKLFGLSFALTAIALLLTSPRSLRVSAVGGWLWGLGALAHTGAVLSLPIIIPMVFGYRLVKDRSLKVIPNILVFIVVLAITFSPWIIYKKTHPKIDTQKLLQMHYFPADFQKMDYDPGRFYSHDLFRLVSGFHAQHPLNEQISVRLRNLSAFVKPFDAWRTKTIALLTGDLQTYFSKQAEIFFKPLMAVGVGPLLTALILAIFLVIRRFTSTHRRGGELFPNGGLLFIAACCFTLLSYAFNALLKWTPPCNHELPYLELLSAIIVVYGFCGVAKWSRALMIAFSFLGFYAFVLFANQRSSISMLDFHSLATLTLAGFAICLAFRWPHRLSAIKESDAHRTRP